jgi:sugar lactone lactonase YvrE
MRFAFCLVLLGGLLLAPVPAADPPDTAFETIDFASDRWEKIGATPAEHLGRPSLCGTATLKDVVFENGVIEVDIACVPGRRGYPGIAFRIQSEGENERFYIRPHRAPFYNDAFQYAATFNGETCWQFYNGPGATAAGTIPVGQWNRLRLEVQGGQARVFFNDMNQPVLLIPHLGHGASRGALGVNAFNDGSAYFSNFRYRADDSLAFPPERPVEMRPGAITRWEVSQVYKAGQFDTDLLLATPDLPKPEWRPVAAEPDGMVNLSRVCRRSGAEPAAVLARTTLRADAPRTMKLALGYSDVVYVFLNGRLLFSGNSAYTSRDPSFLGILGPFDTVYLPLQAGDNELALLVVEAMGGWGFLCLDGEAVFTAAGVTAAWATPRRFLTPETAVWDAARQVFYVSNYSGYTRAVQQPGLEFISTVSANGEILERVWVSGVKNPTGLAVAGDRLFAVGRQALVEIDIPGRAIVARHPFPQAAFPNDIAADSGGRFYISDSLKSVIYRFADGRMEEWLADPRLARPNGLCVVGGRLIVGSAAGAGLLAVDLETKAIQPYAALGDGIVDGLCALPGGALLVSHNEGRLFRVRADGTVERLLDATTAGWNIADFAWVPEKRLVVIPTFADDRVVAYTLP